MGKNYDTFMSENLEIRITGDNSPTLYNAAVGETYHSQYGAVAESKHIFIDSALRAVSGSRLRVLEVGFGTGLNAWLTWEYARSAGVKVEYVSVELYPVEQAVYEQLRYAAVAEEQERFLALHRVEWDEPQRMDECFVLHKHHADFLTLELCGEYDVVYFDAFSPERQGAMWQQVVFERIYAAMRSGGVLTTYCAKGVVRRTLQAVGFCVERLQGPVGGKREILRARKG